jgi:hypothetical protein
VNRVSGGLAGQRPRRKGVRRLVGSFLTWEQPSALPQESVIPITQLHPNMAEIKVAEDTLQPRLIVRSGKKQRAPAKYVKPITTRKRYKMSRLEIAALLDKSGVSEKLPQSMCKHYKSLASRNITMEELAEKHKVSKVAMEAIVDGWESDIVAAMCQAYPKFEPRGTDNVNPNHSEQAEAESEAAQDAEVLKTGGESIGGRIISRGQKDTPGRTFQNKKLDTFERSGGLRGTESSTPDQDFSGGDIGEEDDYSEKSGDDIFRSE